MAALTFPNSPVEGDEITQNGIIYRYDGQAWIAYTDYVQGVSTLDDIGADLADIDLLLVDDGASGTNRKSALSRVWTYIQSKLASFNLTGFTSGVATDGQVLTADGSGGVAWEDAAGGDLVDDLTPQLGGDLDLNGSKVVDDTNATVQFESSVTDGATAVAHSFDTSNTLSDTAKLLSFSNNGTEAAYVRQDGGISAKWLGIGGFNSWNYLQSATMLTNAMGTGGFIVGFKIGEVSWGNITELNCKSYPIGGTLYARIKLRDNNDNYAVSVEHDANPSIFRVYNTHTDASNYERLSLTWDNDVCKIQTEAAGTGSARDLQIDAAGNVLMPNLPTSDPGVTGALWNDSGTLKIST